MRHALPLLAGILLLASPAGAVNDAYAAEQWALERIRAETAWTVSKGAGVVVAVVDSGVYAGHPELQGKVLAGMDYIDGGAPDDENGHGTHMAGTIAAVTANGAGIASVAPSAKILPVRVLDEGGEGTAEDVREGIEWSVDHGADVVNLSLARDGPGDPGLLDLLQSPAIDEGIRYATERGAVVVVAAGNDDTGGNPETSYDATVEGALVVGASTKDDRRAAFSNYGAGLDVLAPGGGSATDADRKTGCVQSNAVLGLYLADAQGPQYAYACGTSVSVAVVSGVAALLVARGMSNGEVVDRLVSTAVDLGAPGRDPQTGYGRVDAAAAVGARASASRQPAARPTASQSPRLPAGSVGGAGKTPKVSVSLTPESPSPSPSPAGTARETVRAAPAAPKGGGNDRGVPIAVATALAAFVAWGHRVFGGSPLLGGTPPRSTSPSGR